MGMPIPLQGINKNKKCQKLTYTTDSLNEITKIKSEKKRKEFEKIKNADIFLF